MKNFLYNIFALVFLLGFLYYFQDPLKVAWLQNQRRYFPCSSPLAYSLGTFDERFGISKEEFLESLNNSENIWEKSYGKELFVYKEDGDLKINLIYDGRQDTTFKLSKIDSALDKNKASFDKLKEQRESLESTYLKEKKELEEKIALFTVRKNKYEQDVLYWNNHGGARSTEYTKLDAERIYLNKEVNAINKIQENLNTKIAQINVFSNDLNNLNKTSNEKINTYNQISKENGEEFNEGIFHTGPEGESIDIFQFENKTKLTRVLAHEFGHALGLDHVEDPEALMYRLNNGYKLELTAEDIIALQKKCNSSLLSKF